MRRFIKFTKILLMLLIITAIINSAPYASFLKASFNCALQVIRDAVLSGIGKTISTDDACEGGEKSVPDSFAQNNSAGKVKHNQQKEKGSLEGDGDYHYPEGAADYNKQDAYRPYDIYSGYDAGQNYDVYPDDDTQVFNEEKSSVDSGKKEVFITIDEIKCFKNMGLADKLKVMAIVRKIDKSNIERIYRIAEGGITYDEIEEINMILRENLTSRHIEELNDIIARNKKLLTQEAKQ